ncbi:NAD(P)H-dependent glycerol-3-phosphate dehydrogenase [Sandarakinorhabdus sp. DWP1-3-1]|uniref:NAD(P)H-dependent glycerol-3-phosphate dehydrogenase n=1 Tax=Sandarakinorhabdus sp. DWP1-3-1 TaxID=2804627 RepID=UPI003CE70071
MTVGVIGGGAWGTALAQVMAETEHVLLWAREPEVVAGINATHENRDFLPGVALSPRIHATGDMADLAGVATWLVVAPAQHLRRVLAAAPLGQRPTLVLCAKGIEAGTHLLMAEVVADVAGADLPFAVLSGPTFAGEVARGLPTAVTLACADAALGETLVARLARPAFRPYLSDDVTGAEIGGAVKNVLAIACGVVEGADLGLNARAALIARGFAEMTRFGLARGGRIETLAGLSGLGDLVLTCSSANSRNFTLGLGIGRGERAADLLDTRTVAEGAATAPVLVAAAAAAGVDMPICNAVAALIGGAPLKETIAALLSRPLKTE